jgi:protein-tyrosine phosphatase
MPSEVVPGLFVGGRPDAAGFDGFRLSVLDDPGDSTPAEAHIPILTGEDGGVDPVALDRAAETIDAALREGRRVLVYCGHGARRSPLAVAWYLHRRRGLSLSDAYVALRTARPRVEPASSWLAKWRSIADR